VRLLYFAPHQAWPVNTGARLRDYQLARHLAARCSLTFAEMRSSREAWCKPPEHCGLTSMITLDKGRTYSPSRILRGLAGPVPLTVLNCWSRRMHSALAEAITSGQFDSVQIEGVHLMEYLPVIRNAVGAAAIVVDWHNVESEVMWRYAATSVSGFKKLAAKRTARLIERAEDRLLASCSMHTVTSERERQKLLARHPDANIMVIPNGVDAGYYSASEIAKASRQTNQSRSKPSIVFVGYMDYHANIDAVTWFSRTVWPEIARNYPEIQLTIVGRDPTSEVRSLASDRIHVTGTVDDVRPYYASAIAAIAPIRSGSGTRLKILEAMAAGVPVVSTRLGAEGLDAEDDVHLLLADSGAEFVAAIRRIVSFAETRNRLSTAARSLVAARYDWQMIGERLYRIHSSLVQARQHSRPISVAAEIRDTNALPA
jgi:sugar transferase (PEP-CTERM/EpsH1 system associated)